MITRGGGGSGGGGQGRGQGSGARKSGGQGRGPGGNCVCQNCGASVPHERGVPCSEAKCPKCGTPMSRE